MVAVLISGLKPRKTKWPLRLDLSEVTGQVWHCHHLGHTHVSMNGERESATHQAVVSCTESGWKRSCSTTALLLPLVTKAVPVTCPAGMWPGSGDVLIPLL